MLFISRDPWPDAPTKWIVHGIAHYFSLPSLAAYRSRDSIQTPAESMASSIVTVDLPAHLLGSTIRRRGYVPTTVKWPP
jgi:hypothetical protein